MDQQILGPYSLNFSSREMEAMARVILNQVIPKSPQQKKIKLSLGSLFLAMIESSKQEFYMERHLDSPIIWSICQDKNLKRKLQENLGDNLKLWRSELWVNKVSKQLIPLWHQDIYPKLRQNNAKTIHAYIGLTPVNAANGFEYIPPEAVKNPLKVKMRDPFSGNPFLDLPPEITKMAKTISLQPGEFILFTDQLIHRSRRNQSDRPRLSLTLRVGESQIELASNKYTSYDHQPVNL